MTVNLADIIKDLDIIQVKGNPLITLHDITFDSRKAAQGVLFVAVRGTRTDGHDFIIDAAESGAEAIVCEKIPENAPGKVCFLLVKDSARALGLLASAFFGNPSGRFRLVGITGTNGKTTTVTLLHRMFTSLGYMSGCFTTIRNYIGNQTVEATHTTPDPVQLNRIMKEMADQGCQYVFMEVSSHALVQQRTAGLIFAGGIFSNITHDHLDYHKTFDEYLKAKKLFFDGLLPGTFACINADDRNGKIMVQNTRARVHYYAIKSMADFKGRIIESHMNGTLVNFDNHEFWTRFLGEFNVYNLLAVYSTAMLMGIPQEEILRVLSSLETVEGRFQYLQSGQGITAVIDYAHTPDAILNVLKTIGQIRKGSAQVISVIGAGGNRDKTKRPEMARVAAGLSDRLILTSDNPRDEEPGDIINDMKAGLNEQMLDKTITQPDRREAIKTACLLARKGDIILIAGKGHENYQEIRGVKHHFSDQEIVAELFDLKPNNL
jgi:UDP-N-acetylmuramoyl-L-alanyl-D-glutamate--2,6-diaminopimelate ligase